MSVTTFNVSRFASCSGQHSEMTEMEGSETRVDFFPDRLFLISTMFIPLSRDSDVGIYAGRESLKLVTF